MSAQSSKLLVNHHHHHSSLLGEDSLPAILFLQTGKNCRSRRGARLTRSNNSYSRAKAALRLRVGLCLVHDADSPLSVIEILC
jgi:hypothetical protein